ncbi:MAG TPA: hypothetical protein VF748_17710 [Candidatus Acidoferrum sp.]
MTSQFQPNTVAYGDAAGLGLWLVGHYRQHLAYNAFLAGQTVPIEIPTYNILTVNGGNIGMRFWLEDHQSWHEDVRPFANVTGIDLSEVDMNNEEQFYSWIDLHNQEHAAIDTAFGLS